MQIRYSVDLTVEEYIEQEACEEAEVTCYPFHSEGGCGFAKHRSPPRKFPNYYLVVRYHCSDAHQSISLLPDFFGSRLPGTLDEVEHAVNIAETSSSFEEAAFMLRPELSLPSGLRWLKRRLQYVDEILTILTDLFVTEYLPQLGSFRKEFRIKNVLSGMRGLARDFIEFLPPIVGLGPRSGNRYSLLRSSNN